MTQVNNISSEELGLSQLRWRSLSSTEPSGSRFRFVNGHSVDVALQVASPNAFVVRPSYIRLSLCTTGDPFTKLFLFAGQLPPYCGLVRSEELEVLIIGGWSDVFGGKDTRHSLMC